MTRPRSELVDREHGGFYHLGARCVRRAMLCGKDPVTKRDLSHRRGWIENLMLRLAEVFTVHVREYAVMSNHYHITVDYRPQERFELGDEEVARRWLKVFPPADPDDLEDRVAGLLGEPERLAVLRDRLGDLSWYMARLNETVARMANQEDGCTGRFWQGRFKSKDLPDERSVWACMAYDALNPVRAGMAEEVDAAQHTGLQRRLEEAEAEPARLDEPLAPLVVRDGRVASARPPTPVLELTLREYRAHVEWTAGHGRRRGSATRHRGSRWWRPSGSAPWRRTCRAGSAPSPEPAGGHSAPDPRRRRAAARYPVCRPPRSLALDSRAAMDGRVNAP